MSIPEFYYELIFQGAHTCTLLVTAYCYTVWIRPFLPDRTKIWLVGVSYAAVALTFWFMPYYIESMLAYGITELIMFFLLCLIDRKYMAQKFFLAITFFCLRWQAARVNVYVSNEIFRLICHFAPPNSNEEYWFRTFVVQQIWDIFLYFLLLYGAVKCLLWSYGCKREHIDRRELLLLSVPSAVGVFTYGVLRYYTYIYTRDTGKSPYDLYGSYDLILLLYTLSCFAVLLVMTYVFRQWKTEQEEDRQRELFSRQMTDLESHIGEVERLYRDIRGLRHDMGNHLMTLRQLYDKGEYAEAEKYAETLQTRIQDASGEIASGNPVTDVILSGRKKEMEEKGIAFACDFHYPLTESVNSFDISIILSNALSNAIEAVERERSDADETVGADAHRTAHISLTSSRRKNIYMIEVTNSYTGSLELDSASGLPPTTKSGEGHGFGLSAIRHVAHKYLGDIEISKEIREGEERFVLRVMLQITD